MLEMQKKKKKKDHTIFAPQNSKVMGISVLQFVVMNQIDHPLGTMNVKWWSEPNFTTVIQ